MTAEELYDLLWPLIGSDRVAASCASAVMDLIADRLPSSELIALGEAAAYWERENELRQNTISADMKLFRAARAYAASVASIPTKQEGR